MFFPNDSRRLPILPKGMELKKMAIILSNLDSLCFDIKYSKFLPIKNNWNNFHTFIHK